jgi:aspartyl/asparaginyl-tRNA synthetase
MRPLLSALIAGVLLFSPTLAQDKQEVIDAKDVETLKKKDKAKVTVRGTVQSTHVAGSAKVMYLNLGPDYKTCFKVVIFKDDFDKREKGTAGIKDRYEKKTITVEGKIKLYKDQPEIVVKSPSDIDVEK